MLENVFLNYLPIIATILIVTSYMGQLKKTYGTKNVEGQSLFFWTVLNLALLINVVREVYLFSQHGTYGGLLTQGFNLALGSAIFVGVLLYRKKEQTETSPTNYSDYEDRINQLEKRVSGVVSVIQIHDKHMIEIGSKVAVLESVIFSPTEGVDSDESDGY